MNALKLQSIYIAALFVAILGIIAFVLYPSVDSIMAQRMDLTTLTKQIQENTDSSSKSLAETEFDTQKQTVLDIYNKALMTPENQIEFVRFFENLEREDIRTQISFNPTEKMLIQKQIVTPFRVSVMSNLPQFLQYLYDLEKAEYYLLVSEIKMTPIKSTATPEITVRGLIEGFVYLE